MRPRLATLLLIALVTVAGCSEDRRSPGPESLDDVDVTPSVTVEIDEDGFDPGSIEVGVDEVFEVVNAGSDEHSFEIDEPFIDTGTLLPGEGTSISMGTVGTHVAVDGSDPDHTLEIIVEPTG